MIYVVWNGTEPVDIPLYLTSRRYPARPDIPDIHQRDRQSSLGGRRQEPPTPINIITGPRLYYLAWPT